MKTSAFISQTALFGVLSIVAAGGVGLYSVQVRHNISVAAASNRAIEGQITEVSRHSEELRTAIAQEQDLTVLQRRNLDWNLGLVPPRPEQVQAVGEDPMMRLAAKRNRDLFSVGVEPVSFRMGVRR